MRRRPPVPSPAAVLAAAVAVLVAALAPAGAAAASPPRELRVVLANVGNVNVPGCADQVFKLCLRPVEARAAAALRALRPDVSGLIEVLPADLCDRAPSSNPANLCAGARPGPASQVARLLGDDHAQACDDRFGWDCVAVRPRGGVELAGWSTRPAVDACADAGFTLAHGTVRLGGWPVAVALAHPSSTDAPCRAAALRDLFGALPQDGPALVLGDLNLDPYREDDASVAVWREQVPGRFTPLSSDALTSFPGAPSQLDPSGEVLDGPVRVDAGPLAPRAIDHVLARGGLTGSCSVARVDGGGGMDHRAQVCRVLVGPAAAPRILVRRRGRSCTLRAGLVPAPSAGLTGVRFTLGRRTVVDRAAPFTVRQRAGRAAARRLVVQPLTGIGEGPRVVRRLRPC